MNSFVNLMKDMIVYIPREIDKHKHESYISKNLASMGLESPSMDPRLQNLPKLLLRKKRMKQQKLGP